MVADKVEELEQCGIAGIHPKSIQKAKERMPCEGHLFDSTDFFCIFADPTRVGITCVLFSIKLCVYDIVELLEISQSAISHRLHVLRQTWSIRSCRVSKVIYYLLDDGHIGGILSLGLGHIREK